MGNPIWQAEYKIYKVNGETYDKEPDQFRGTEEEVRRQMKTGAEALAQKFDFALVEVTVKNLHNGDVLNYRYESEGGFVRKPENF